MPYDPNELEIPKGCSIHTAAVMAIAEARKRDAKVKITFNDLPIWVGLDSAPDDIAHIYSLLSRIRQLHSVMTTEGHCR